MSEAELTLEEYITRDLSDKEAKDLPSFNEVELTFLFGLRNKMHKSKDGKLVVTDKQKSWALSLFEKMNDPFVDASFRLKRSKTIAAAIKRQNTEYIKDINAMTECIRDNKKKLRDLEKEIKSYQKTLLAIDTTRKV